jgi:hypothetical protein
MFPGMSIIRRLILAALLALSIAPAFGQSAPPPVPALPDTERRTSYTISGSTCACAVNMALYGDSTDVDAWLEVWISGTKYLSSDPTFGWTITSPTGALSSIPRPITDAVLTFNNPVTGTVQIVGARRPRRTTQFSENRGVAARDLNQAITDLVAMLREDWDKINDVSGRSILGQPGDSWQPLPKASTRANQLLGFDGSGKPILYIPSSVSPSSGSCAAHNWVSSISVGGAIGCTQPSFSDLSGSLPTTAGRIKLTSTTAFQVDRTNGIDQVGCGLSTGAAACQTPQYLTNILLTNYDFAWQQVTINLAHSASNYGPWQVTGAWVGGNASNVTYVGDVASQSSVVVDGAGGNYCVQALGYASFVVRGLTVQNCANALAAPQQHAELYFDHITWSSMPAGGQNIYASRQGYVEVVGGGNIINSVGSQFITASHQGNFRAAQSATGNTAFTLGANISCTSGQFAYASSQGDITFTLYNGSPFALGGFTSTCQQWSADSQGLFQALQASTGASMMPNFFPGTAGSGSCLGDCSVDQGAHIGTTVTGCGSGAGVSGNDFYGTVVEGTGATACNVVFKAAFTGAPHCTISWRTAVPGTLTYTTSISALGLSHASTSGATFDYQCKGY